MKTAVQIVFRRLTAADFYNINKPRGSEPRGGGQTYIDFPITTVSAADWHRFFTGQKTLVQRGGPYWSFLLHSIGIPDTQHVELGQRRPQSFSIRRQTLGRKNSNRVLAWHPMHGFPPPKNRGDRSGIQNLVVYIIRTAEGEYWAGWFRAAKPLPGWHVDKRLLAMFTAPSGIIDLHPVASFDEKDQEWPFRPAEAAAASVVEPRVALAKPTAAAAKKQITAFRQRTEDEIVKDLFENDVSRDVPLVKKRIVISVLRRNQKIVAALKQLYGGKCQLTDQKYVFKKRDGSFYCEAHHLIPLGEGGADSPYNLIIVSPLIHMMLHYAEVSGLDLSKIANNRLVITINGECFTIKWHPKHAELVGSEKKH